ncbi:hypothetical protein HBB16_18425 [Pseudonocardia sp. MCCB 268]|nr:hypothetical protein [Pseudonocardia cytotoxica]
MLLAGEPSVGAGADRLAAVALLFLFDWLPVAELISSCSGWASLTAVSQLYREIAPGVTAPGLVYPALRTRYCGGAVRAADDGAARGVRPAGRLRPVAGDPATRPGCWRRWPGSRRTRPRAAQRPSPVRSRGVNLLSYSDGDYDRSAPGRGALAELGRLRHVENPDPVLDGLDPMIDDRDAALLSTSAPTPPSRLATARRRRRTGSSHRVEPVLRQLVELRPEQEITLEVEAGRWSWRPRRP